MTPLRQRAQNLLTTNAETWRDRLAHIDALPQLTLLGLLTGVTAGFVIVFFRLLIDLPMGLLLPGHPENFEALSQWARMVLPLTGACLLGLALAKIAEQHHAAGIGHVLNRLHNHQGRMPLGNFITQFFGGILCLVSGQSVGREGPAVHIGAASGSLLGQWLKLPNNSLRPLMGCGVAAAIAASFNTPMAGVIFAMEVVLMEYTIAGFIPIILAAVAGTTITHMVFGPDITFSPPQSPLANEWELLLMVIAGLATALFAACFIRLQSLSCRLSLNRPIWLRFLVAGMITGILALGAPEIMGVGYDTIESAFSGEVTVIFLLTILVAKLIATAITLGVGMPGGVVGPCLVMGACAGGIVGIIAQNHLPMVTSDPGFYVVLGMGAMMGAILNAPLAAMVAILELTHNPHLIFPSMLMVVAACLTTRWAFRCDGLFQTILRVQGKYNEPEWRQQILSRSGVRSLLDRNIRVINPQPAIADITHHLQSCPHWLILEDTELLINATDVQRHVEALAQEGKMQEGNPVEQVNLLEIPARRLQMTQVPAHANLYEAWQQLKQTQADALYILGKGNKIIGIITRDTVENF